MVADKVTVVSRSLDSEQAYKWESSGAEGYTIEEIEKEDVGTEITLTLKEDTEEESYSEYLEEFRLQEIIKKHSDFIRYPIKMEVTKSKPKDDEDRKSTRLNSSHVAISYAVFCLKKKSEERRNI